MLYHEGMSDKAPTRFLTAEWRHLLMLNYVVDPQLLQSRVPAGTELDLWQGRAYISVVGFLFLRTRVLGMPIPFHTNFVEVNLRFYVRYQSDEGWRRGVVFVRELVPRRAIAWVARYVFNEPYAYTPMNYTLERDHEGLIRSVGYTWDGRQTTGQLVAKVEGTPVPLVNGSEEEFITEHYWGYSGQRDGSTMEYRVEHPPWRVSRCATATFDGTIEHIYGPEFVGPLREPPASTFLADGSPITVYKGTRLK